MTGAVLSSLDDLLIFSKMCYYYSYFTDEETSIERLTNLPKITKLVSRFKPRKSGTGAQDINYHY